MRSRSRIAHVLVAATLLLAGSASASDFSPATLDAQIQQCANDIDADSLFSYMNQLAAFGTRHTNSDTTSTTFGVGAARRWVFDKFVEFANSGGNLTASYHDYTTPIQGITKLRRNVIGEIPGTLAGTPEHRIYLIGGHLDSRNDVADDSTGVAPGVDDDASGVACALELARVMSLKTWAHTIRFVAFTSEEQGLVGSDFLSRDMEFLGEPLAAMLNNDTMASINGAPHPDSTVTTDTTLARCFAEGPEESPSRQMQRYLKAMGDVYVPIQDIVLIPDVDRPGRGGDHESFNARGFTAIRYMEHNERVDLQHTPFDTMGVHLDKNYQRRNAQVDLATLANLMEAPASPPGLTVADIGDSSGFRLTWPSANTEPNLDGYLVTTRAPGSLDYDSVTDVGMVNEHTLVTAADSLWFGLSIKDTDDHRALILHEVLGVKSTLPVAPLDLVATPEFTGVLLEWNPNAEGDLDGYNVYRSDISGTGYLQLNGSPVTDAFYDDTSAVPGTYHYYVVTAVDMSANESPFSEEAVGRRLSLDSGILFVHETDDGNNAWFPSVVGADSVYQNQLGAIAHDTWIVENEGVPTLSDLAIYSSVIWAGDDFNGAFQGYTLVSQLLKDAVDVLSDYMDAGGNVMLAGWEGAKGIKTVLDYPLDLGPGDFLYDRFGIDAVDNKRQPACSGVLGQNFFDDMALDPGRLRPAWSGNIFRIEYFTGLRVDTDVAFLFDSADPDSAYHQQPCAAYRDGGGYRTVYWGFPLYHFDNAHAHAALEAAMGWFGELSTDAPTLSGSLALALGQNRPNPFRGETEIEYVVPGPRTAIDLAIYDVAGRRVRSLVKGPVPGGAYVATWDGRNEKGRRVSSGVYFYRLVGADRELTKKLVLLR